MRRKGLRDIRKACAEFIYKLDTELGLVLDPRIFETLAEEALKVDLKLCAYQRGIQGTHVCFEITGDRTLTGEEFNTDEPLSVSPSSLS